jgi:hypothetical protein
MNQYSRTLIRQFTSAENTAFLLNKLTSTFNKYPNVRSYLHDNFDSVVLNYADRLAHELNMSDPMIGVTNEQQLSCFNTQFVGDVTNYIIEHVLGGEEAPAYTVHDGLPTSRRGVSHHQRKPNDILNIWRSSPGRPCEVRSDCAGDPDGGYGRSEWYTDNPYYGTRDRHLSTGIVFCDQSHLGMQNHIDQYENTSYKIALNTTSRPHELVPFGVSTPASDARLLQRSIFRKNENGVENGILNREARLQRRYLERDINEGLRNAEKGYLLHGHDMTSLYKRIDHKNQVRNKYIQH